MTSVIHYKLEEGTWMVWNDFYCETYEVAVGSVLDLWLANSTCVKRL